MKIEDSLNQSHGRFGWRIDQGAVASGREQDKNA